MGLERSLINPYILTRLAIKKILVSKIGQNVPNFNFRSIFVFLDTVKCLLMYEVSWQYQTYLVVWTLHM